MTASALNEVPLSIFMWARCTLHAILFCRGVSRCQYLSEVTAEALDLASETLKEDLVGIVF